jgi:mRNA-degrading endonuclease toxin of MazEF toxin-antitoxin module
LIISNNNYNNNFPDILVCVITSNLFRDQYSVSLNNDDLEIGNLPEESVIKCHKLFTIEQSQILKRYSIISIDKFEEASKVLIRLIEKSN